MDRLDANDDDCSICLGLMVEPVKLPCKHYLCYSCAENSFNYKRSCPYCRQDLPSNFGLKVDWQKQQEIKGHDKKAFERREAELKELRLLESQKINVEFRYGNRHFYLNDENLGSNQHKWTVFVEKSGTSDDIKKYIKQVTFELHPTFYNPIKVKTKAPFEQTCTGWGVFNIPITIKWQPWLEMGDLHLDHYLSFNGNGRSTKHTIKIDKSCLEKAK